MKKSIMTPFACPWLTPVYDWYISHRGFDLEYYKKLVLTSGIRNNQTLLDVGCATGTFIIEAKKMFPDAKIIGIEPDKKSLLITKRKMEKEKVEVQLMKGIAEQLPFEDDFFDVVVSTNTFHHLPGENKIRASKEIYRVLKPEGKFILVDIADVKNPILRHLYYIIYSSEHAKEHINGKIRGILTDAGFDIKVINKDKGFRSCWQMQKPKNFSRLSY